MATTSTRAGDQVTWIHEQADGQRLARAGTVWGDAPQLGGAHCQELWVIPDRSAAGEPPAIVIATVRKSSHLYTAAGHRFGPGEIFAETSPASPTGEAAATYLAASRDLREGRTVTVTATAGKHHIHPGWIYAHAISVQPAAAG